MGVLVVLVVVAFLLALGLFGNLLGDVWRRRRVSDLAASST